MYNKNLLLLLITVLLPLAQSLSAYHGQKLPLLQQEYGDTDALIASTTQELKHAYDLLEMLKKRSEDMTTAGNLSSTGTRLPRNFDAIRDEMVKKQLIAVLSATPFSSPEKHIADCKAAIHALEEYSKTLQQSIQSKTTEMAPAPLANELSNAYDLTASHTPKTTQPAALSLEKTPALPASAPSLSTLPPLPAPTPVPVPALNPVSTAPTMPITAPALQTPVEPLPAATAPLLSQPFDTFKKTEGALTAEAMTPALPSPASMPMSPAPVAPETQLPALPTPAVMPAFAPAPSVNSAPEPQPIPMGADLFTTPALPTQTTATSAPSPEPAAIPTPAVTPTPTLPAPPAAKI